MIGHPSDLLSDVDRVGLHCAPPARTEPTLPTSRPRRPGRPATLTSGAIVDAALALIEETGALRLVDLGQRLGVDTSATYRYFRSREDLVSAIADRFTAPLREPLTPTGNWRADFEAHIHRLEDLYRTHPAVAQLILTEAELSGPVLDLIKLGASLLRQSGADEREVFMALHAVEVAVFGSVTYDGVGGADADTIRRRYHASVGTFDVDALFPTPDDLAHESTTTMWRLVGAALDRLEHAH